jgi:hypothetical protein
VKAVMFCAHADMLACLGRAEKGHCAGWLEWNRWGP